MFFVQIAGRLGKDPETRFTSSGQKVTSFNVAVNQRKGKEDVTTWVRVTIWGDRLDKIVAYLKKGSAVIISGKMSPPSIYTDKEGRTQITLEITAELIEFSPFGNKDERAAETPSTATYATQQPDQSSFAHEEPFQGGTYGRNSTPYGGSSLTGQAAHSNANEDEMPF